MVTKLPKQWKHWCMRTGLRPTTGTFRKCGGDPKYDWLTLKGHGHMWRVNCFNEFQLGDPYDRFDRWANNDITISKPLPTSLLEFSDAVKQMLAEYNEAKV